MKKIFFTILLVFSFSLFSCYNGVFQSIRKEVELEDALINGFINSIVRYTDEANNEYIFMQNGLVYYKYVGNNLSGPLSENATHGTWSKYNFEGLSYSYFDQKFSGRFCIKLASDSEYVYALCAIPEYDENSSRNIARDIKLYCLKPFSDSSWEPVSSVNTAIEKYISKLDKDYYMMDASIHLFCTNAPQNAHRKAFIRIGGSGSNNSASVNSTYRENGNFGVIVLNGKETKVTDEEGAPKIVDCTSIDKNTTGYVDASAGVGVKTLSVVYFNGAYKFLDYLASSTNETLDSDATWYYYGDGKTLCSSSLTETVSTSGCNDTILSLCVTKDFILLGTYESGAYRVGLTDSKPSKSTVGFETNGDDVMCDPYIVRMMFCTDPRIGETETGSALYSSMQFRYTQSSANANYKNVGLWSYYSSRNNWNKE